MTWFSAATAEDGAAASRLTDETPSAIPHREVPALLLFDIDGTLLDIEAGAAHRTAIYSALRIVYGVDRPEAAGVQTWGKTDLLLGREILAALGRPQAWFEQRAAAYCSVAAREHARLCTLDLTPHVIAGMAELLEDLAQRDDVVLGLVTGNIRGIAQQKLERARLDHLFSAEIGAYGCEAEDRAALPARARARAAVGVIPHPPERTWVIGDTPNDIACARADGAHSIAVTSGPYTADAVDAADYVAITTDDLRQWLKCELNN
jgi:phosphoglycolate phosphatase